VEHTGVLVAVTTMTTATALAGLVGEARAAEPTHGYQEPVIQWVVQKGETCASIATSAYGSARHTGLLGRYSRVRCGGELPEGLTLVIPASATALPDARVKSLNPAVKAKPAGGAFAAIAPGAPLQGGASVQTESTGRADIEFLDRTRIFLADNTLVVIHGTAARTSVKKNVPPVVELESGEVKMGLAALRGEAVELGVTGGARVSAASKDAVVEKKGVRTTVAVFDGSASLSNGGTSVSIPKNFGARAEGSKPPAPPRPLPPAPHWASATGDRGAFPEIALTLTSQGPDVVLGWDAVDKAKAYRIEIARDAGFGDLLVRTEVPATTKTLRAEGLPPGAYWISVRAIDDEEFLGVAATRSHLVVAMTPKAGPATLDDTTGTLTVAPFTVLEFPPLAGAAASSKLSISLDKGSPSPLPAEVALGKLAPHELGLSAEGGLARTLAVAMRRPGAEASLVYEAGPAGGGTPGVWKLSGNLTDVSAADAAAFVKPVAKVTPAARAGETTTPTTVPLRLEGTSFVGVLGGDPNQWTHATVEIVDGNGVSLARSDARGGPAAPPPPAPVEVPLLGVTAPLLSVSPDVAGTWTAPTLPRAGSIAGAGAFPEGGGVVSGAVRATGTVGIVGLEASVRSRGTRAAFVDEGAWFGVRARVLRRGLAAFELAPVFRVSVPTSIAGPIARFEPALALGGLSGKLSWVGQLGGRFRGSEDAASSRLSVPGAQGFGNLGAAYHATPLLRAYGAVDLQVHPDVRGADPDTVVLRGGLTAGLEVGRQVFGGAGARVTPWSGSGSGSGSGSASTGPVEAQLTLGIRER
jgi:hypothetical protein